MTPEARHLHLLCPFNLFKLVCIHAIPTNSRMLLHSKLMKIRLWKRKKQLNIGIYGSFFLAQMKLFILTQKKSSKIGICRWANTQRFQLGCFEIDMCFGLEWLKDVLCERELIKLLSRPRSCSIVGEAAYAWPQRPPHEEHWWCKSMESCVKTHSYWVLVKNWIVG